jgi:hypothetical protein
MSFRSRSKLVQTILQGRPNILDGVQVRRVRRVGDATKLEGLACILGVFSIMTGSVVFLDKRRTSPSLQLVDSVFERSPHDPFSVLNSVQTTSLVAGRIFKDVASLQGRPARYSKEGTLVISS